MGREPEGKVGSSSDESSEGDPRVVATNQQCSSKGRDVIRIKWECRLQRMGDMRRPKTARRSKWRSIFQVLDLLDGLP